MFNYKKHGSECVYQRIDDANAKVLAASEMKAIVQRLANHRVILISRVTIKQYSSVTLPARKLLSQIARCLSFFNSLPSTDFGFKQNKIDPTAFQLNFSYNTRRRDKVMINYSVLLVCSILRQIS